MQAYVIHEWGGTENLKLETLAMPRPKQNEVVVAVHTVGLNPIDYISLSGTLKDSIRLPAIIGWDVAGTVSAVAPNSSDLSVGDEVMGLVNFPATDGSLNGGGYGEYVAVPADQLIKKPADLSFETAAALPAVGLTAWQALKDDSIKIAAGRRALVHGAAGGVGHILVQLTKQAGYYVATTARGSSRDFVLSLGADEVIDYKTEQFEKMIKDFDIVFDTVGGGVLRRSLSVLRPGGTLITAQWPELPSITAAAAEMGVHAAAVKVRPDPDDLMLLSKKVETGKLKVHIDQIVPFGQLPDALQRLREGGVKGKIVVKIR